MGTRRAEVREANRERLVAAVERFSAMAGHAEDGRAIGDKRTPKYESSSCYKSSRQLKSLLELPLGPVFVSQFFPIAIALDVLAFQPDWWFSVSMIKRDLPPAKLLDLLSPIPDGWLQREHPDLASRLRVQSGASIEPVNSLYKLAGGHRWKPSFAGKSRCADATRGWLDCQGLNLYSHFGNRATPHGGHDGRLMLDSVLGQLGPKDFVVVVDPAQPAGVQLLTGEVPSEEASWIVPEVGPDASPDMRVRVANLRDVLAVRATLRWESEWLSW